MKAVCILLLFSFYLRAHAQSFENRIPSGSSSQEEGAKKSQIDDVFLWKVSDQLKLTLKKEKELSDILKNSNFAKAKVSEQIQDTIGAMAKVKDDKKRKLLINEYRRHLKTHNDLNFKELDQLQKLLGEVDFTQYLVLKQEFAEKVKSLLIQEKSKSN